MILNKFGQSDETYDACITQHYKDYTVSKNSAKYGEQLIVNTSNFNNETLKHSLASRYLTLIPMIDELNKETLQLRYLGKKQLPGNKEINELSFN